MAPCKQKPLNVLLLLLVCSYSVHTGAKHNATLSCLPNQASSLLQIKLSFTDIDENLASWQAGRDCCRWEGVTCDMASGRVVSLDLSGFNLQSSGLDSALFNLTSLRSLNFASNDFRYAHLPSYGFERLIDIRHLNFSATNFFGQIPVGIARLKNLVTLDFSDNNNMFLQEPNFPTLMANLSHLRELHFDEVDISRSGSTWSLVLADSVPQLQILSLSLCGISGHIHPSFSRLRSLRQINLGYNLGLTGNIPEFFSDFSSLGILDISFNSFDGFFPRKIFKITSLVSLDLSNNPSLSVCLPDFPFGNNLETLNLAGCALSCDILPSLTKLGSLRILGLSTTGISKDLSMIHKLQSLNELQLYGLGIEKPVFSWIANLEQLTSLKLDGYDFSQSAPYWIGNLSSLEILEISGCNFSGPIPYQIGNLTNLTSLVLAGCNFFGPIPSTIGNLAKLEYMWAQGNNISGEIPKSLFALPLLQALVLSSNQLCGDLKDISPAVSSPLTVIWLDNNQLTGPVPKSFFHLNYLQNLNLGSNRFSGTLEISSFWSLKSLTSLILSNNMLSIMDEEVNTYLSLPNINYLELASCRLTKIPEALKYLDKVVNLDLSNNKINGLIPSWVWENWKDHLKILNLSHNMFSSVESFSSLVHLPYLSILDLSFNILQGSIPIPVILYFSSPLPSYREVLLDYSNNNFSSISPNFGKHFKNVTYLNLSKNKLNGHVPSSICSATELSIMDLSYNNFSGSVPSCLLESGKLNILKLRENKFQGTLSNDIAEGCKLQTIDLNGNQIEGKLPRSLSNCPELELLDVGSNQIVDSFPSWLGVLAHIRVLVLRSNRFNGTIWDNKDDHHINNPFPSLQILDLASNNFSGNLPIGWFIKLKAMIASVDDNGQALGYWTKSTKGFYQDTVVVTFKGVELSFTKILAAFNVIDFSENSFDGPVAESIGSLVSLHGLNMSHNNFTGQIPSEFGNLSRLESMDLSWNGISGKIPQELAPLTSLEWLNLSYNNLSGRIPQGNQFLTFSSSSFEGNAGLCGLPLSKQCDSPGSDAVVSPEPNSLWQDRLGVILLFAFVGLGFGVGFALSFVLRLFCNIEGRVCKHR